MRLSLHVGFISCYYKSHHVKASSWRMMIYFDITWLLNKSCQLALTHLLITSGLYGTFPHLSTTHGCISIIEFLQFTIVYSFWTSLGKALFQKVCQQDVIKGKNTHNCVGKHKF